MRAAMTRAATGWAAATVVIGLVPAVPATADYVGSGPFRVIAGTHTGLSSANAVALDKAGNLYVNNFPGSITVYAPGAAGDARPIRTIAGSSTGLDTAGARDVTVGADGRVYVLDGFWKVRVFAAGATGNVAPERVISALPDGLNAPSGIAVDPAGYLYVANGNGNRITEFAPNASGMSHPVRFIENTFIHASTDIEVAGDSIYLANGTEIQQYPLSASGNVAPTRVLRGLPDNPVFQQLDVDSSGNVYATVPTKAAVMVFAAGASGSVTPLRRLTGPDTQLAPSGIAVGPDRTVYVTNGTSITEYHPLAPLRVPGAVESVKVRGKETARKRIVTWKVPSTDGGSPVGSYRVVVKRHSWILLDKTVSASKHRLKLRTDHLMAGKLRVYVSAGNVAGYGPTVKHKLRIHTR